MDTKKLSKDKLGEFVAVLAKQNKLYIPQKEGENLKFKPLSGDQEELDFPRITTVPPKDVFFPQAETRAVSNKVAPISVFRRKKKAVV